MKLSFDEDALNFIVDKTDELKLGARGLRSVLEIIMRETMYEMPGSKMKKYHVTLEEAKQRFEASAFGKMVAGQALAG